VDITSAVYCFSSDNMAQTTQHIFLQNYPNNVTSALVVAISNSVQKHSANGYVNCNFITRRLRNFAMPAHLTSDVFHSYLHSFCYTIRLSFMNNKTNMYHSNATTESQKLKKEKEIYACTAYNNMHETHRPQRRSKTQLATIRRTR